MQLTDYIINIHHLTLSIKGKKIVNDISICLPRGKIYGFIGPNGSGKTTIMKMICGLVVPDAGQGTCIYFDIIKESQKIRHHIGYMAQQFNYWEDLTVKENLSFVSKIYNPLDHKDRVKRIINEFKLDKYTDYLASYLSGGWKQRLALAASVIHSPELLVLDEPTAGVDLKARREFWNEIHRLVSQGMTILVSTHFMDEAVQCDKILYVDNGKIMTMGSAAEIIEKVGLSTFAVKGPKIIALCMEMQSNPSLAFLNIAMFGNCLHVSGVDLNALEIATTWITQKKIYHLEKIESTLEDIIIFHMNQSEAKSNDY